MATEKANITEKNNDTCYLVPVTDIYENENEYTLKMEMPGVGKENLEVVLDNDILEIIGKADVAKEEGMELKLAEFALHDYNRKFKIGNDINRDEIKASLDNGVLTLTLHKREEVKPKKIEINVH